MVKTYASPLAFNAALTHATKSMAIKHGMSVPELRNIFFFNRFAARVFTLDPDGWLMKGGQALLVRYDTAARLSTDIDLQSTSLDRTVDEVHALLLRAAAKDLGGDFLRFAADRYAPVSEEGRGGTQYFKVFLGPKPTGTIKVDFSVGRTLVGTPEIRTLKSAVDLEWPVDWPQVHLYPVVDHIADKVFAMYERHGSGGSNRYRDLADLLLISQQEAIDGQQAHYALHREAARRQGLGTDLTLPTLFQPPGPDWEANYPTAAKLVLGLVGCGTFAEASKAVSVFIDPLLDGTASGRWQPQTAIWN